MKNHKSKPTIIDRACWAYVDALFSALGRIIYVCTLGLLLAVLRGINSGLEAFTKELGRRW